MLTESYNDKKSDKPKRRLYNRYYRHNNKPPNNRQLESVNKIPESKFGNLTSYDVSVYYYYDVCR